MVLILTVKYDIPLTVWPLSTLKYFVTILIHSYSMSLVLCSSRSIYVQILYEIFYYPYRHYFQTIFCYTMICFTLSKGQIICVSICEYYIFLINRSNFKELLSIFLKQVVFWEFNVFLLTPEKEDCSQWLPLLSGFSNHGLTH